MNIQRRKSLVVLVSSFLLFISCISVSNAETEKQTEQRMIKEAKEAADRAAKREENRGQNEFEVKRPNDDHIKETEKAAARPVVKKEKKENK